MSRDLIVSTALGILGREGLHGLSLRRVAAALDTGAASLYVYIANLGELHALMLDRALERVELRAEPAPGWRGRLVSVLVSYRDVLLGHRGLANLALTTIATGPGSLRIWERLLGLLREGGAGEVAAARGVDLLTLYVTAVAAEQSNWREHGEGVGRVKETLAGVSPAAFPLVAAAREAFLSGDGEERFRWAVDVILDGLTGPQVSPAEPAAPGPRRARSRGGSPPGKR